MREGSLLRRFVGFTTIPMVSFVAPLILLPIVSRIGGVDGWASIGIGQSLGGFGAIVTSYGWNVIGSARVAIDRDDETRRTIYAQSLWNRGIVFVFAVAAVGSVAFLISAPEYRWVGALTATASSFGGLSISWFGVGTSSSQLILKYEAIPSALAVLVAIPLLLYSRQLVFFPIVTIVGAVSGLVLMYLAMYRRQPPPPPRSLRLGRIFRSNMGPALIDATGAAYTSATVPLSSTFGTISDAAGVTSADKVYRLGLMAIMITGNALQGWVLEVSPAEGRIRRQLVGVVTHLLVGLVGLAVLLFGGRLIAGAFLGSHVVPPEQIFVWYGLAYFCVSTSTPLIRNVLIPAGRTRIVLAATVTSAMVGISSMVIFGLVLGSIGVIMAFALSEFIVIAVLTWPATKVLLGERDQLHRVADPTALKE
jgi:O-antigen/teichoic acid export membrane protein